MDSKTTLSAANDFAKGYDEYIQNSQWFGPDILFGLMFEYISPNQTMLDIGIGTGLGSQIFNNYGLTIYGIDGSEEMIKLSREKGFAKELRTVDLTERKPWFENIKFDHLISHGVFHLIGDLTNILEQASSILKPHGCFGFTVEGLRKSVNDYKESSISGLFEYHNPETGITCYKHSENYILNQIKKYGFKLLKKTEYLAFVDSTDNRKVYFEMFIIQKINNL